MIAYLCATPYHIFNAINTKVQLYKDEEADLFVFNHMYNYKEVAKSAKQIGIFRNVILVDDCPGNKNEHGLNLARYYYKHYRAIKSAIRAVTQSLRYDMIIFNFPDSVSNELFFKGMKRVNSSIKALYFEDGIATYINEFESFPVKLKLFLKLFGLTGFHKYIDNIFYYKPDLSQTAFRQVQQLPAPNNIALAKINEMFKFEENSILAQRKFIIFEESFNQDGVILNDLEILKHITDFLPKKKCSLKKHPRSSSDRVVALGVDVVQGNSPWEVFCLNNDFSSNVLISISSSALLSPKIIFNQEPTLIFLYELLSEKTPYHSRAFIKHIDNVRKLYKGNNFYIPNTYEELDKVLTKILEEDHTK